MNERSRYSWQDASLDLYGSEMDRRIRKAAVAGDPQWMGTKGRVGMRIWRIAEYRVEVWPQERYGSFYSGNCYIILSSYLKDPTIKKISYDIHLWLGENCTSDDYVTGVYKMLELDRLLGDISSLKNPRSSSSRSPRNSKNPGPSLSVISLSSSGYAAESTFATQHREVMNYESDQFFRYFPHGVQYFEGVAEGIELTIHPEKEMKPTFWQVNMIRSYVTLKEIKMSRHYMKGNEVFILDAGAHIWQWNGKNSTEIKKSKANEKINSLISERSGEHILTKILEQGVNDDELSASEFFKYLSPVDDVAYIEEKVTDGCDDEGSTKKIIPTLYSVEDRRKFTFLHSSEIFSKQYIDGSSSKARSSPVLLLDTGHHVYMWVAKESPSTARSDAIKTGQQYLKDHSRPATMPITRLIQGYESSHFLAFFDDNLVVENSGCACLIM